jgi:hypothetical protein
MLTSRPRTVSIHLVKRGDFGRHHGRLHAAHQAFGETYNIAIQSKEGNRAATKQQKNIRRSIACDYYGGELADH